jgi:hypothetical protein
MNTAASLFDTVYRGTTKPILKDVKATQPYLRSDFTTRTEPKSLMGYTYSSDAGMPKHDLRTQNLIIPTSMKPNGPRTELLYEDIPKPMKPEPGFYYKTNTELDDELATMKDGLRRSRVGSNQDGSARKQEDIMRVLTSLNVKKDIPDYKFSDSELNEMKAILPEDQYSQIVGFLNNPNRGRVVPVQPEQRAVRDPAPQDDELKVAADGNIVPPEEPKSGPKSLPRSMLGDLMSGRVKLKKATKEEDPDTKKSSLAGGMDMIAELKRAQGKKLKSSADRKLAPKASKETPAEAEVRLVRERMMKNRPKLKPVSSDDDADNEWQDPPHLTPTAKDASWLKESMELYTKHRSEFAKVLRNEAKGADGQIPPDSVYTSALRRFVRSTKDEEGKLYSGDDLNNAILIRAYQKIGGQSVDTIPNASVPYKAVEDLFAAALLSMGGKSEMSWRQILTLVNKAFNDTKQTSVPAEEQDEKASTPIGDIQKMTTGQFITTILDKEQNVQLGSQNIQETIDYIRTKHGSLDPVIEPTMVSKVIIIAAIQRLIGDTLGGAKPYDTIPLYDGVRTHKYSYNKLQELSGAIQVEMDNFNGAITWDSIKKKAKAVNDKLKRSKTSRWFGLT